MSCNPKRISNTVMDVVQIEDRGWLSSHVITFHSGRGCMSSEMTLVSRMIILETLAVRQNSRAVPRYGGPGHSWGTMRPTPFPVRRQEHLLHAQQRAEYREL